MYWSCLPIGSPSDVDLDARRPARPGPVGLNLPHAVHVQRLQQRRGEAAGRAEPGARRDVGQRGDLDLRRLKSDQPQRLADDRVLDLVDRSTCSSCEYFRKMPGANGRCTLM